MNKIRLAMTVFIGAVVATCALGWNWSTVLPPEKRFSARLVLVAASVFALVAAGVIWSAKRARRVA